MRKLVWIGLAVAAFGVLVRAQEEEDGAGVVAAPFLLALGIECAVFALRSHQSRLLSESSALSA
jgi:hypothetical protein